MHTCIHTCIYIYIYISKIIVIIFIITYVILYKYIYLYIYMIQKWHRQKFKNVLSFFLNLQMLKKMAKSVKIIHVRTNYKQTGQSTSTKNWRYAIKSYDTNRAILYKTSNGGLERKCEQSSWCNTLKRNSRLKRSLYIYI